MQLIVNVGTNHTESPICLESCNRKLRETICRNDCKKIKIQVATLWKVNETRVELLPRHAIHSNNGYDFDIYSL